MALFKKKDGGGHTRVFYATDVHGSERTFRKFLVPIVHEHDSHYRVTLQGSTESIEGDSALQGVKERIETLGFYHTTMDEDELHAMQEHPEEIDKLFRQLGRERLER